MSQHQPVNIPDFFPGELPKFVVGQVVRHKRYGYRGVIVDFDMRCQADDKWYHTAHVQLSKEQPWYHVLVHGSSGNTYAAEESLELIEMDEPVVHPLLSVFFDPVDEGEYARNDEHWPGWNG